MTLERRTWDSEARSPWNPRIHSILKTIDLHVEFYTQTGEIFHLEMAHTLRLYVLRLKEWIHAKEGR